MEAASRAHAMYHLGYAQKKRGEWQVVPGGEWIAPMLPEIDNFRAALAWLREAEPIDGGELAAALFRFFDRLALQEEGLRWIEAALGADATLPKPLEGDLYEARGILLINQGRFEASIGAAQRALEVARQLGDERRLVPTLLMMANALRLTGQDQKRAEIAEETSALAHALDDELLISRADILLATASFDDVPRKRELFARSIATQKRLRRQRLAALSMLYWTNWEFDLGDYTAAQAVGAQAVEMCRSIEPTMHVRSLGSLAVAFAHGGEPARALTTAMEQLELGAAFHKPLDCQSAVIILVAMQEDDTDAVLHAKLLGYGNIGSGRTGDRWWQMVTALRERAVAGVIARLGQATFEAYAAEGSAWDEETAYAHARKLRVR